MSTTYQNILTTTTNGVLTLTINRPEKMNALNILTITEIGDVMLKAIEDDTVKAVLITGSGEKAFVAGADISELTTLSKDKAQQLSKAGQDIFSMIENSPKPVIAAVNGFALGGGCELALACHMRIASDNAKFGLPEVTLGLLPGYGGTQRMTQLIGKGKALELMLTGNMISAAEAKDLGLVNIVVPQDQLRATCQQLLDRILQLAPLAQKHIIAAANTAVYHPEKGQEQEAASFGTLSGTEDFIEGTKAFLEKRKAVFKGK